jgi:chemotaxis protein methyltransferase CheR
MSRHQGAAAVARRREPPPSNDEGREFVFSDADFRALAKLAHEHAGISLGEGKRNLVYGRLSRRLRSLGMTTFQEYRDFLAQDRQEIENFINSISTNLTRFFRESHHFDHLYEAVASRFSSRTLSERRLRVWSAGCSTGEEPYTIAAVLQRGIRDIARCDVRILATDIDTEVLRKAASGEYGINSLEEIPNIYREYFPVDRDDRGRGQIMIGEATKDLIAFRRLNLMEPWPFQGLFDAIFCRNVMIYFDGPTKANLIDRFTKQVKPGGFLYIGHSESLHGGHPGLDLVGRTIYRRQA